MIVDHGGPHEPPESVYFQCVLRRGATTRTTWLPAAFANLGNELRLKGQPGWVVTEVGAVSTLGRLDWQRQADLRAAGRGVARRPPPGIEGF